MAKLSPAPARTEKSACGTPVQIRVNVSREALPPQILEIGALPLTGLSFERWIPSATRWFNGICPKQVNGVLLWDQILIRAGIAGLLMVGRWRSALAMAW